MFAVFSPHQFFLGVFFFFFRGVHGFCSQGSKKNKKGRRLVTNLREGPYSLKDGDVVGVVDRLEDQDGLADLTRADDEVREGFDVPDVTESGVAKASCFRRRGLHDGLPARPWS